MDMGVIMKIGMIVLGIVMISAGFLFHSIKKLTVNFAVGWAGLGLLFLLLAVITPLSVWSRMFAAWQGIPVLCITVVIFAGGFACSILFSQLIKKNRELAMQVSILMEETERMKLHAEEDLKQHEKAVVGY